MSYKTTENTISSSLVPNKKIKMSDITHQTQQIMKQEQTWKAVSARKAEQRMNNTKSILDY